MRENKTPFRVVVYPLIWVGFSFIIGIPVGILISLVFPILDDVIVSGMVLGIGAAILLFSPVLIYYSINAIRDIYRGGVMTPRYFEMIDNGIRLRSENGEFDVMFAWHEFSLVKHIPPLGVMRLIPYREKVTTDKGTEFDFREYWITVTRNEFQRIRDIHQRERTISS